jgi:predicted secreted hydrolase
MPTKGTLTVDERAFEVEGLSWMDHEFGTSFLEPAQLGWDWLALQLDEGTDLMLYEMRRRDGQRDPYSKGTMVDREGRPTRLDVTRFALEPIERWTSPASGASYPVAWRVRIPSRRAVLTVRAVIPAQELRTERSTRVTYWEGAVTVEGQMDGRPVRGRGYLEMTGYSGESLSDALR